MEYWLEAITVPKLIGALAFSLIATLVALLLISLQQKLIISSGHRNSLWQFTGGDREDKFFDLDTIVMTPVGARLAVDWYSDQIRHIQKELGHIDKLVFIERDSGPVGAIMLAGLLAEKTNIPSIVVRPKRRIYAASFSIPSVTNAFMSGETLIIISDVATSGRGIEIAIERLHGLEIGLKVPYALVWFDWNKGAAKKLEEKYDLCLVSYERAPVMTE